MEAAIQGQAAAGGIGRTNSAGSTTIADMIAISAIAVNGSSLIFRNAFQPAWQAAPSSTARKTDVSTLRLKARAGRIMRGLEAPPGPPPFAPAFDLEARREPGIVDARATGGRITERHDA